MRPTVNGSTYLHHRHARDRRADRARDRRADRALPPPTPPHRRRPSSLTSCIRHAVARVLLLRPRNALLSGEPSRVSHCEPRTSASNP